MRILALMITITLSACSTAPAMHKNIQQFNANQEATFQPTRAKFTELAGGSTNLEFGIWAGEVGKTAANQEYQRKIFDNIKSHCGFEENSLKEVRIVKHEPPLWYEVWVFNNPSSDRPDKTAGFSVVMNYNPQTNITQISFPGGCK